MTTATAERGEMSILDRTGDMKVTWDPANPAEVEMARAQFEAAKAKGYAAYTLGEGGATGEVIKKFDPSARRIILRPQMVGG
jgi:hypothetical protein